MFNRFRRARAEKRERRSWGTFVFGLFVLVVVAFMVVLSIRLIVSVFWDYAAWDAACRVAGGIPMKGRVCLDPTSILEVEY